MDDDGGCCDRVFQEDECGLMESAIKILLGVCVGIYAVSFLVLALKHRKKMGWALFFTGWLVNASVFGLNWVVCDAPPFGNMYHVLVFLSMTFFPIYLLLACRDRLAMLSHYFAFAAIIPVTGAFFMGRNVYWKRMPALQSPWFVPHVFSYMVSYALAALAFSIIAVKAFRQHVLKFEDAERRGDAGYQVARLAFPFMTFGLLSGALWAEEAWGRYWSWDPKETWALITWTMYVIYFHCRACSDLKKYQDLVHVLAFLALLATFILVNILPKLASTLHSYAS